MFKQKVIKIKDFVKLERALADGFNVQYMLTKSIVLLSKFIPEVTNRNRDESIYGESIVTNSLQPIANHLIGTRLPY